MKHPLLPAAIVALLIVGAPHVARSETATLIADRSHSEIGFNIRHFFNQVHGRFNDYTVKIVYDTTRVAASSVEAVIRDSSIQTGDEHRDENLRGEDFFWNAKYPNVTFKSAQIVPGKDAKHFQVMGDLTIRDVTKPVTLEVELLGAGKIGRKGTAGFQAGFVATTTIDRKDYGITWNRTLDEGGVMLGDDVQIVLNVAAWTPPPPKPAAPAPTAGTPSTVESKDKK